MKVRIIATGEIKEVSRGIYSPYQYVDKEGTIYTENDVEELPGDDGAIFFDPTIDYWTRLEHQYAGMAMQTMLATLYNPKYHKELMACYTEVDAEEVARLSKYYAHALVEKMKEERK